MKLTEGDKNLFKIVNLSRELYYLGVERTKGYVAWKKKGVNNEMH